MSTTIQKKLAEIKTRKRIPALAAGALIDGQIGEITAVGKRKVGHSATVEIADKWHVGSCTKAMTSTVAGILIERGYIDWDTTISDSFKDCNYEIHEGWRKATLEQLLCHHGGAPHTMGSSLWERFENERGKIANQKQRNQLIPELLMNEPRCVPGSHYIYSNSGYAIAGVMLEICTGKDWETLITENLFQPLNMKSAGFGAPGEPDAIDQPLGHERIKGKLVPVEPGPRADNPAAIWPATSVHCSIEDHLKFAAVHIEPRSLIQESILRRLHRRYGASEYSLGWSVVQRSWGKGHVLWHNGSNGKWMATMWIAPYRNAAFVAASNVGGTAAQRACNEAVTHMIDKFL